MERYNAQMVNDFINGWCASGYNLLELANDYDFMVSVFEQTNDKTMYYLCSLRLKRNYHFVKYLVNKFSDDLEFVQRVANFYLQQDSHDTNELLNFLLIMNFFTLSHADENLKYQQLLNEFYEDMMSKIDVFLDGIDERLSREYGMGFCLLNETFGLNEVSIAFFARKLINSLCAGNELKKYLHDNYSNYDEIMGKGICNVLIDFVSLYDDALTEYVRKNKNILMDYAVYLEEIKNNWNNYEKVVPENIWYTIIDEMTKYLQNNNLDGFEAIEILCLAFQKMDSNTKLRLISRKNATLKKFEGSAIDESTISEEKRKHIDNIVEIVSEIVENESRSDFSTSKNSNGNKVLQFRARL